MFSWDHFEKNYFLAMSTKISTFEEMDFLLDFLKNHFLSISGKIPTKDFCLDIIEKIVYVASEQPYIWRLSN